MKITMIGAGSAGFCMKIVRDILLHEELSEAHFSLMDVDGERLKVTHQVMEQMKVQHNLKCTFSATTNRRKAFEGADFAISMIQVGGLEPYEIDIKIPLKYGIDQCVGDTVNPGGIFRGLRHVPAFMDMCRDMEDVCPDVIFMNYANPMTICSWAKQIAYPHIASVGLCHGVQHTTRMLCDWLGVKQADCDIVTSGINHMAWFTKFEHKGKDLYPRLWRKLDKEGPIAGEEYRFEMFKAAGLFMTESPGHLSEYLPYFRKRRDLQDLFGGPGFSGETGAYLKMCKRGLKTYTKRMADQASGKSPIPFGPENMSVEYAAGIIRAKVTNEPYVFAGNILNKGFIPNLPYDCCVEVPICVDRIGMRGTFVGDLPPQCAALCQTNVSVQELAVAAALEGDREAVFHACMMDPLTAAVLAPHEIRNMVEEMLEAQKQWLPQFKGRSKQAPGWKIGRMKTGRKSAGKSSKLKYRIGHYD